MEENVSTLLNFPTETFRQTLDQLHHRASSLLSLPLQWKDFDEHLASVNTAIRERAKELHSSQESVGRTLELKSQESLLDEKERDFELKEAQIEASMKRFDGKFEDLELKEEMIREWAEEVELEKNRYEALCKEVESKQKQRLKEVNHGYSAIIDGKALQVYLNEHSGEIESMRFAVSMALGHSSDPYMLVLDALQGFYPPHLKKGGKEFDDSGVVRSSCSVLLEELMKFSPKIQPSGKREARRIASDWERKLESNAQHFLEVLCFLQLVACFGLASAFETNKLLALLEIVSNHCLAPVFFRSLGFANKASDFVHRLVAKKKLYEAIKFIHEFEMFGPFQPVSLLNDFLGKDLTHEGQISTPEKRLTDIKYALRCIEEYKIHYGPRIRSSNSK